MTPTERQRIEKDAEDYAFQIPYDGTQNFYDMAKYEGYIAGATAEHDKARNQAIDACIAEVNKLSWNALPALIQRLESLKTNQIT